MKTELNDGERSVVLTILTSKNEPGHGPRDYPSAEQIKGIREDLNMVNLQASKYSDYFNVADYGIDLRTARWIDDEMDKLMKQGNVPAVLSEFTISLHDKMRDIINELAEDEEKDAHPDK